MSSLRLETSGLKTAFRPGEEVSGMAMWQLDKPPKTIEIRLFWYTSGKGTQDVGVVDTVRFDQPPQSHATRFMTRMPAGPYSFSGRLVSVLWALELVVLPSGETERLDLTFSPTGNEILLRGPP